MPRKKKRYDYPVYVIEWLDAVFDSNDSTKSDKLPPDVVKSVGWVIYEDDECLTICQDHGKGEWVRRRLSIPVEMIIEKKKL